MSIRRNGRRKEWKREREREREGGGGGKEELRQLNAYEEEPLCRKQNVHLPRAHDGK
jgi:hypothetical protein